MGLLPSFYPKLFFYPPGARVISQYDNNVWLGGAILLNRIIFFLCMYASLLAGTPLSPGVQAVVDHYASPDVYNAFINKGQAATEQFTDPAFTDRFVHAEERRKESYMNWYNTPCFGQPSTVPTWAPTLQKGDVAFLGIAGAGWGLEWLLYTNTHQFFARAYLKQLQADDETTFYAYKQKEHWATLISLAAMSTLANCAFSYTTKKVYFDSWLNTEHQQRSIVHVLPGSLKQHLMQAINPQTWFDTCNEWFDYFGLIPDWSKTNTVYFSKALLCNLACIVWYERKILAPRWQEHCKELNLDNTSIKKQFPTPEEQETFINDALALPFLPWLQNKYYVTAFCNTCVSGALALTAVYKAYKTLKPILQEPPCVNAA